MKLLVLILFSSGLYASEPLKKFCSDSVFLIQVLKAYDLFELKTLGKVHIDYQRKIEERPDLKNKLRKEMWELSSEYKKSKPSWACDVEQIPEMMETLYRKGKRRVDLCFEAKNPKSLLTDLSLEDARPVHPYDLAKEIKGAWKLAMEKTLDLHDLSADLCGKRIEQKFEGAGESFFSERDPKGRCATLLEYSNFLSSIKETCSKKE